MNLQVLKPASRILPGYREIELNVFDSVDSSIRRDPISIVFRKFFFNYSVLDQVFCIELDKYRPSELGSIIFRSKRTVLRKNLGGTYKREIS